ncbi:Protoporphyrinogen IX oxidase, aerobic, HemY [Rhodopirellula islandica]|uniref:Coproporphyrinogen III oxidase n=1 Tax=Rhodopirellula islandica TaxID=595434 RepID=A0A0J1B744_RHOIS|nr:protoporphyrinogen oxidase [Rhodopirellula islandica]KLU02557.1 Protoporphyrinogen IX oxidase, aerobic, HemY [Rhodopirellula islandica]
MKIAIIGGGLSGLSTAAHLRLLAQKQNKPLPQITLFEAAERLGGVIHTETLTDDQGRTFVIDHGADMFATAPPAAIDLCEQLGVADQLLRPNPLGRGAMIARGNQLIPIPEGFVLMRPTKLGSMLTTSLLSLSGKFRLLRERLIPRRDDSVTDESVGSFVRRRLGEECLDNIVAPLVAGIYTADVDRLSMAATMKPIWDMETNDGSLAKATLRRIRTGEDSTEQASSGARYEKFRAFPNGMKQWIDTLADFTGRENIRLNTAVRSIVPLADRRYRLEIESVDNSPSPQEFDQVVVSTPAHIAANLLQPLSDEAASTLRSIPFASTAIVVMAVRRDCIQRFPTTFGFVVPPKENRRVLAGSFASTKFPQRAPDDYVIVRAFVGGMLQPEILEHSDDEITEIVRAELGDLIGLDQTQPLKDIAAVVQVVRWNNAMPQYEVGHLDKAQQIRTAIESLPGLHLNTNALGGVGIAPVIAASKRTAERILK